MNSFHKSWQQRPFYKISVTILLLLILLAACSSEIETVTVEVTRVVTETVVEEGETIEVTRVVTETVIETVEGETEDDSEPPSATSSEGDAGPLPPPPDNEPKVSESRGPAQTAAMIGETAVTPRASQTSPTNNGQANASSTIPQLSPTEIQKWCQLAAKLHKKQCN